MAPTKDEKLAQVERICQSATLNGSELLKAFLHFIVLKAVDDPEAQPKEYLIATEVFGRDQAFDPRQDSVVRVQARRLRAKLEEYYATEGKADHVLITLPKGRYTPLFAYLHNGHTQPSVEAWAESEDNSSPEALSATDSAVANQYFAQRNKLIIGGLALLTVLFGLAAGYYWSQLNRLKTVLAAQPGALAVDAPEVKAFSLVWHEFLRSPNPVLVTYSNAVFCGTPQDGLKVWKGLEGLSSNSVLAPQSITNDNSDCQPFNDHYTGIGEVKAVGLLADVFGKLRQPYRIKRSLLINWDDLKVENIVILGSTAENIFLRDLPQRQDFVFKYVPLAADKNQSWDISIQNLNPKPGEQAVYSLKRDGPSTQQVVEEYALVSLLRGLASKHRLLILAGITTMGTEAAAEYVSKPEYVAELISRLNQAPPGQSVALPSSYQILLKVQITGGVPTQVSYVTHHVLN